MEKQRKLEYLYATILTIFCLLIFGPFLLEMFIVGPFADSTYHPITGKFSNFNPFGIGRSNENIALLLAGSLFIIPILGWIANRQKIRFWQALLMGLVMLVYFLFQYFTLIRK